MLKLAKSIKPVMFVLTLSACQQQKQDLTGYVAEVKSRQHADIAAIPVMKPYEKFVYKATDLRDPFVATVTDLPIVNDKSAKKVIENGIKPDLERLKEALEFYALSELVLVGTLEQKSDGIWGLVRAPDGVIHRVQTGNYIGQNYGKVLTITDVGLTLKEIIADQEAGYIEREASLSVMN
jgi:type IV pilus assembly protein PilP